MNKLREWLWEHEVEEKVSVALLGVVVALCTTVVFLAIVELVGGGVCR